MRPAYLRVRVLGARLDNRQELLLRGEQVAKLLRELMQHEKRRGPPSRHLVFETKLGNMLANVRLRLQQCSVRVPGVAAPVDGAEKSSAKKWRALSGNVEIIMRGVPNGGVKASASVRLCG